MLNYKNSEERMSYVLKPVTSLKKGTGLGFKRRELHTHKTLKDKYRQMFEMRGGSDNASEASHASSSRVSRSSLDTKSLTESIDEMSKLLDDLSVAGSAADSKGGGGAWDAAGIAIKKHFTLLKNGRGGAGNANLYKDEKINRFYERFLTEGPRRGDGCIESDNKEISIQAFEIKLHKSKESRIQQNSSLRDVKMKNMGMTKKQERVMHDLVQKCAVARRKLMNSKVWQENNQEKMDRIRDRKDVKKRSWRDIFGSDDESSEEEDEPVVEEVKKPPTREDLWMADLSREESKVKEKRKGFSEVSCFLLLVVCFLPTLLFV